MHIIISLFLLSREFADVPIKDIVVSSSHLALLLSNGYIYRLSYSLNSGDNHPKEKMYVIVIYMYIKFIVIILVVKLAMMKVSLPAVFQDQEGLPPNVLVPTLLCEGTKLK